MSRIREKQYAVGPKQATRVQSSNRDLAYGILRREILLGRIQGGTRINESELAEKMGISRTPIREALLQLHGEGVISKSKAGLKVKEFSGKNLIRQIEFRTIIECAAARLAVQRITPEQLDRLQHIIDHMKFLTQPKDHDAFIENDLEFHTLILKATDNPSLIRMSTTLASGFIVLNENGEESITVNGQPRILHGDSNILVISDHQDILDTIQAKNADKAEALMHTHITRCLVDKNDLLPYQGSGIRTTSQSAG